MNRHTKLFVGILSIVLILLIVATISFSVDISKNSEKDTGLTVNPDGAEIFQGDNKLYGVRDANGNTILEAKWKALQFLGNSYVSASTETDDGTQMGVLDLNGNLAVPFLYQKIEVLTDSYYVATLAETGQKIVYDNTFRALDSLVADEYTWTEPTLILTVGEDAFHYSKNGSVFVMERAELSRASEECPFSVNWNTSNADLLQPQEWINVTDLLESFLVMMQSNEFAEIEQVTDQTHEEGILSTASQADQKVTSIGQTAFLSAELSAQGSPVLTWQIDVTLQTKDAEPQQRILTVKMEQSQQANWIITELQLA